MAAPQESPQPSTPGKYCDSTPVGLDSSRSSRGVTCGVGFKSSNSAEKGWGCFLPVLSSSRKLQLMMSHLESTFGACACAATKAKFRPKAEGHSRVVTAWGRGERAIDVLLSLIVLFYRSRLTCTTAAGQIGRYRQAVTGRSNAEIASSL